MFSLQSVKHTLATLIVCIGVLLSTSQITSAAVTGIPGQIELDGYMWSSTIGWISLNCKTGGTGAINICGSGINQSDYRVVIGTNGLVTGYAWSSNIGWIRFGGLSQFPLDAGNPEESPGVNRARLMGVYSKTNPDLTFAGWARACAGTAAGDCSTMTSRIDGWNGWISLKGDNYQLRFNANGTMYTTNTSGKTAKDGFFWGSSVVGWIGADDSMNWSSNSGVLTCTLADLSNSCVCTIATGQSTCPVTLSWVFSPNNIANPNVYRTTSPAAIVASTVTGSTPIQVTNATSLSYRARTGTTNLTNANVSKTLSAACGANNIWSNGKCIFDPTAQPVVTLVAARTVVRAGDSVTLDWTIGGVPNNTSCVLKGPTVPANYIKDQLSTAGSFDTGSLTSFSNFTLSCKNGAFTASTNVSVEIIPTVSEN